MTKPMTKPPDTRNLEAMPNTLAWLKANINGFAEYHEAARRANQRNAALDALLEAQTQEVKPNG